MPDSKRTPECVICGRPMQLMDEDEERWYCHADDQVFLGKQNTWKPEATREPLAEAKRQPRAPVPEMFHRGYCVRCKEERKLIAIWMLPAHEQFKNAPQPPTGAAWACTNCKAILNEDLAPIAEYEITKPRTWGVIILGLGVSLMLEGLFYRADQFWMYMVWVITGALPVGLLWEGVRGKSERLRKTPSMSCVSCGRAMRYSFSRDQWQRQLALHQRHQILRSTVE